MLNTYTHILLSYMTAINMTNYITVIFTQLILQYVKSFIWNRGVNMYWAEEV